MSREITYVNVMLYWTMLIDPHKFLNKGGEIYTIKTSSELITRVIDRHYSSIFSSTKL